jgi:hypothetical protein
VLFPWRQILPLIAILQKISKYWCKEIALHTLLIPGNLLMSTILSEAENRSLKKDVEPVPLLVLRFKLGSVLGSSDLVSPLRNSNLFTVILWPTLPHKASFA